MELHGLMFCHITKPCSVMMTCGYFKNLAFIQPFGKKLLILNTYLSLRIIKIVFELKNTTQN